MERIGYRSPARVMGEGGFLRVGGITVFNFKGLKHSDCGKVEPRLFVQTAFADAVGFGYSEVSVGPFFGNVRLAGAENGGSMSSAGRKAHSRVAISQAS